MDSLLVHQPAIAIFSHLLFTVAAFYALQALRVDKIIKKNQVLQAQLFYIVMSIAIGWAVSNYVLELSFWARRLPMMFS